jgi:hypothetical protein
MSQAKNTILMGDVATVANVKKQSWLSTKGLRKPSRIPNCHKEYKQETATTHGVSYLRETYRGMSNCVSHARTLYLLQCN